MKVYIVAGLHGDEVFGLKIAGIIQQSNCPNHIVRIGHPEAVAKAKRYITSDLNRSFRCRNNTIEAQLAAGIEQDIKSLKPDYVVDIHTSVSNVSRVAIVAKYCTKTSYLAQVLGMESIVVMPKSLTKHALIGCAPGSSISVELGKFQRSDKLAQDIAKRLRLLKVSPIQHQQQLPVFKVVSTIDKNFNGLEKIRNLEFNQDLGGYPFLAGPDTYASTGGFLALRIK